MINIETMRFQNLNGDGDHYGYRISDENGIQEYVDNYESKEELSDEVNMFTIRDIIESNHYELYLDLKNGGEFKFNGRRMYF